MKTVYFVFIFVFIATAQGRATPPIKAPPLASAVAQGDASPPSPLKGWSLTSLFGFNACLPSGSARCDATYPGLNFGLSSEYKWTHIGLSAQVDWGSLLALGEGSDELSHHFRHIGIGVRAYLPRSISKAYYLGGSIGLGDVEIRDAQSDSSVTWSTLWSDLRLDVGAVWLKGDHYAIESAVSLLMHLGGQRCVLFRGAGPCEAVSELPEIERSSARVLMLRIGARWLP